MPTAYITPAVINEYAEKEKSARWYYTALGSLFSDEPAVQHWVEQQIANEIASLDSFSKGGFSACALIPVEYDRMARKWFLRGLYMGTKRVNGDLDKSLKLTDSMGPADRPVPKRLPEEGWSETGEVEPDDFRDSLTDPEDNK